MREPDIIDYRRTRPAGVTVTRGTAAATAIVVATLTAPNGYPCRLRKIVQSWSPGGDTFVFWALAIGGIIQDAEGLGWQDQAYCGIGQDRRPPALHIPGGSKVEMLAYCLTGPTADPIFYPEIELEVLDNIYADMRR